MHCPSRLILTTPGSIVDQRGLTSARIRVCFCACVYSVYARVHLFCLVCVVCVPLLGTPIDLLPPSSPPRFDCLITIHTPYSVPGTEYIGFRSRQAWTPLTGRPTTAAPNSATQTAPKCSSHHHQRRTITTTSTTAHPPPLARFPAALPIPWDTTPKPSPAQPQCQRLRRILKEEEKEEEEKRQIKEKRAAF